MKKLKVATCFSGGFGSVELALKYENIPHEVVFACEWLEPQRKSYIQNHGEPTSSFYRDIRDLDGTKYKGKIDYLHLSPPCQSYSLAGQRGGASDERGGLMFETIRVIDEVQPKIFTIENVKGLLSSNGGEDWRNIMRDLKSLPGYTITYGVINAKEQGTPQNRERVFIVGFRANSQMMPFPERIPLDKCLADVLEDDVNEKYYLSEKAISGFIRKESYNSIKAGYINQDTQGSTVYKTDKESPALCSFTHGYVQGYILDQIGLIGEENQQGMRIYSPNGIATTQNAQGGGYGAKTGLYMIGASRGRNQHNPRDRTTGAPTEQRLEINDSGCTNALTTVQKDNYVIEPTMRIRRLTPRECARVQGDFNDTFIMDGFSDTKLYEFIGNAMDISTTRRLILRMIEHSKSLKWDEPQDPSFIMREMKSQNLFEMEI